MPFHSMIDMSALAAFARAFMHTIVKALEGVC